MSASANPVANRFDITIVGGGMVGLSMARMVAAEFPLASVCLLEKEMFSGADEMYQPSFDARNTALAPGSVEVFSALGMWERMREYATPILHVQVSDKGHFGTTDFSSAENNAAPLGYVMENAWMGRCLIDRLADYPNVHCLAPAKVTGLVLQKNGARLEVQYAEQTQSLQSDLLIIADGVGSSLRAQLGIEVRQRSYRQHALIANLECSEPHRGRAFERFSSEGPLALLPLGYSPGSNQCALVYTRPEDKLAASMALEDKDFLAEVQSAFGYRLGRFTRVGKRHSYPLSLSFAKEQVRSSLVLLGNAAHFLHPVAGQGFNLALRDAVQLVSALKPAYESRYTGDGSTRFGDLNLLENYVRLQGRDQDVTTFISDSFNHLFSDNNRVKQAGRNLGLLALELNDGLKREVFYRMMGQSLRRAPLAIFEDG